MMPRIAVTSLEKKPEAAQLADQLHLPFVNELNESYDYFLILTSHYLGLQNKNSKKPFYIDFTSGKLRFRSSQARRSNELLAKAIGLSPHDKPTIIDATAGLGRDSFILATLGFRVVMLERSSILHALLLDALERAQKDRELAPIIERLTLYHMDALSWLSTSKKPEVIYLDPMFPERKKSASVKKEMTILHDLLGTDSDSEKLFELAFACATRRVVVKRPRLAAAISTQSKPDYSIKGKSSRFDIHLIPKR